MSLGSSETPSSSSFESLKQEVNKYSQTSDFDSSIKAIEVFLKTEDGNRSENQILELLGDCYYNLAFQQKTRESFKKVILQAKDSYDKIADNRCRARAAFCKFWSSDDIDERHKLIFDECLPRARTTVLQHDSPLHNYRAFDSEKARVRADVELLEYVDAAIALSSANKETEQQLLEEEHRLSWEGYLRWQSSQYHNALVRFLECYLLTSGLLDSDDQKKQVLVNIHSLIDRLIEIGQNVGSNSKLRAQAYLVSAVIAVEELSDFARAYPLTEQAFTLAKESRDSCLIGRAMFEEGRMLYWIAHSKDTSEERKNLFEAATRFLSNSVEEVKISLPTSFCLSISWPYVWLVDNLQFLSRNVEGESGKLELLDKAIEKAREWMQSPFFDHDSTFLVRYGNVLRHKARLVPDRKERVALLEEAVRLCESSLKSDAASFESLKGDTTRWNVGTHFQFFGSIKAEFAQVKETEEEKRQLLRQSIMDFKKSAELCVPLSTLSLSITVARLYENWGNTASSLFDLSHDRADCFDATRAYEEAIRFYTQTNLVGYVAPIYWKIARLYDSVSEYSKSSASFASASQKYQAASENQKGLRTMFSELSIYMKAWSRIEETRLLLDDEKYEIASEKLEEVADVLGRTDSFRHLAGYYLAFSRMEEAEEQSRNESNLEASSFFGEAYAIFEQTSNRILELAKERKSEQTELEDWARLSGSRGKYCLARKELEDARVLEKKSELRQCIAKYHAAGEIFAELKGEETASEKDRTEFEALSTACEAWATMKEAEHSSSSELYSKASRLFMKAKSEKLKQSFILSCFANSSICEAFEIGTRFENSNDVSLYSDIKSKLDIAARYYERAKLEIASKWTRATETFFDALAYLASAEREIDQQKKMQMYYLAEKHLELSANRYGEIGYDKKRQEILRHLKSARENKALLISPIEALSQSPSISNTPVNFNRDQPVGLERFEVANVTGSFSVAEKSIGLGSSLQIDFELANIGKTAALLLKLQDIADENSFDLENESDRRRQDSGGTGKKIFIDLRGKRLEYLKSHDLSVSLKAKSLGSFEFKPKVIFIDEVGNYRSYQFVPQVVEVRGEMDYAIGAQKRRLVAIMYTDIVGYTALTQSDEAKTMKLLEKHNTLLRPFFSKFEGREVKTMGDSFLVEFDSALDATNCAIEIQQFLHDYNMSSTDEDDDSDLGPINLRIGIHLGDVIHKESDVFGDAVNIASRIQPLAEPGGICISQQVYDQIHNKISYPLEALEKGELKNVKFATNIFAIVMPWRKK